MQLVLYRENGTKASMAFSPHAQTTEVELRDQLCCVREDEWVSVQLIQDSDEETSIRDAFLLQVGNDPDYKASLEYLKPNDATPRIRDFTCRVDKNTPSGSFPLFFDTIGDSFLLLYHCNRDGSREAQPLFQTPIAVKPSPERLHLLEETVQELLRIAPQTIRSGKDGQNKSIVKYDWSTGSASIASPAIEFEEIQRTIKNLSPFVLKMMRRPAYSVSTASRRTAYECVRRLNFAVAKQLEKHGDMHGNNKVVYEKRSICSLVSPAHAAIRNFLIMLKGRLCRIKCILDENHRNTIHSNDLLRNIIREGREKWVSSARANSDAHYKSLMARINRNLDFLKWLLSNPFWTGNEHNDVDMLHISPELFSGNECYRFIYRESIRFLRKHFWWVPLEDANHLIASLKRENDNNGLQRKYSILYEYWCFWRLIHGFESEGFDFGSARAALRQSLSRTLVIGPEGLDLAPAALGNMEIKLIHDFRAYLKSANIESQFKITEGTTLSPDFALIVKNMTSGHWFWMLLDAKSNDKLNENGIKTRDKYLSRITYAPDAKDNGKDAEQSWLIYAGSTKGRAGLEGCDNDDPSLYEWNDELDADTCFGDNKHNMTCSIDDGIQTRTKGNCDNLKFRGHIRANAQTSPLDKLDDDPFRQFARIQIATAQRHLGVTIPIRDGIRT